MRPVDAPEDLRVQPRLQVVQGPVVRRSGYLPCNYVNRVVRQGGIDDFLRLDEHEPFPNPDCDLISPDLPASHHFDDLLELVVHWNRAGWGLALGLDTPASPLEGLLQAHGFDRFEQVVDGIHLKCLDGVLVEGCHENQRRRLIPLFEQPPRHLEPPEPGHLDIQEHQVGFVSFYSGERFYPVGGLANHFDIAELVELVTELLASQLLVVDDKNSHSTTSKTPGVISSSLPRKSHPVSQAVICCTAVNSGISMRALVPRPGSLVSLSW
jgi:hypothetical protein